MLLKIRQLIHDWLPIAEKRAGGKYAGKSRDVIENKLRQSVAFLLSRDVDEKK
jgi:hypothetical protein